MPESRDQTRALRVRRLQEARARDSLDKRKRAIDACEELVSAGIQVTHSRVSRKAGVSNWLTYNAPDVRHAVQAAQARQREQGIEPEGSRRAGVRITSESLQTDLALVREDNRRLREDLKALRLRFEQRLGAEIEEISAIELLARVREAETRNGELNRMVAARDGQIADMTQRIAELEVEVEVKAELVRSMMFAQNVTAPRTPS